MYMDILYIYQIIHEVIAVRNCENYQCYCWSTFTVIIHWGPWKYNAV